MSEVSLHDTHGDSNGLDTNYSIKLTIEFGKKMTGGRTEMTISDLKDIVQVIVSNSPEHPMTKVFQAYLAGLQSAHSRLDMNVKVPAVITSYWGDCGSCPDPLGYKGVPNYMSPGNSTCPRCSNERY